MKHGLLGFCPISTNNALQSVTKPLYRITNGSTIFYSDTKKDINKLKKATATQIPVRVFKNRATGLHVLKRYRKKGKFGYSYTYGAGLREEALLDKQWKVDKTIGYISLVPFTGSLELPVFDFESGRGQLEFSSLELYALSIGGVIGKIKDLIEKAQGVLEEGEEVLRGAVGQVIEWTSGGKVEGNPATSGFFMHQKNLAIQSATIWIARFGENPPSGNYSVTYKDASGNNQTLTLGANWQSRISSATAYKCYYQKINLLNLLTSQRQTAKLYRSGQSEQISSCVVITLPSGFSQTLDKANLRVNRRGHSFSANIALPSIFNDFSKPLTINRKRLNKKSTPSLISESLRQVSKIYLRGKFTVFLGSCFHYLNDNGAVTWAYQKLLTRHGIRPDVNFFAGDLVYLDAPWTEYLTYRYNTNQLRRKLTNRYLASMQSLEILHRNSSNIFISDDHEFHNDYPDAPPFIAPMHGSGGNTYKNTWQSIAKKLFRDIQSDQPVVSFDIGTDLSFFIMDTRINRSGNNFMTSSAMRSLENWVKNLKSPGVILSSQILLDAHGGIGPVPLQLEKKLLDYSQFSELCKILSGTSHDLIFLSGDVHFGRIATVQLESGKSLYEVISSPLSLVEDPHGNSSGVIAKGRWNINDTNNEPKKFPQISIPGISRRDINYIEATSSKPKDTERSAENFFTITFSKNAQLEIVANVKAWLPRKNPDEHHIHMDFEYEIKLT